MNRIMAMPEMKKAIANLGPIPQDPPSFEDTRSYTKSEIGKWGSLVKSLGLEESR